MIYFEWPPQNILTFMLLSWKDFPEEGGVKDSKWGGHRVEGWKLDRRRLLGERGPCSRQGLGKKLSASRVYVSIVPPSFYLPLLQPCSFSPRFQLFIKRIFGGGVGWGGLSHICVKQRGTKTGGSYQTPELVLSNLAAADKNHFHLHPSTLCPYSG